MRWLERVASNRFTTLDGGAWTLYRSVQGSQHQYRGWAVVQKCCMDCFKLGGKRCKDLGASLRQDMTQKKLRVLANISVKVEMRPHSSDANQPLSRGDGIPHVKVDPSTSA
eukprot:gene11862-biopygen7852